MKKHSCLACLSRKQPRTKPQAKQPRCQQSAQNCLLLSNLSKKTPHLPFPPGPSQTPRQAATLRSSQFSFNQISKLNARQSSEKPSPVRADSLERFELGGQYLEIYAEGTWRRSSRPAEQVIRLIVQLLRGE